MTPCYTSLILLLPCLTLGNLLSVCRKGRSPIAGTQGFDFGQIVVPMTSRRNVVTITNTGSSTTSVAAKPIGDSSLKFDPWLLCETSLVAGRAARWWSALHQQHRARWRAVTARYRS